MYIVIYIINNLYINIIYILYIYIYIYSLHQVNFLDVIIKLQDNEFLTDLHCMKTDSH